MSTIQKHLLVTDRVRRPPAEGFSWVDRRFLRDFASRLSGDAVFLYFFLAAVSDRQGLSFYSELVVHDLVAYQAPLTQVLSLPRPHVERGGPAALRELLRTLADEDESAAGRRNV